MVNLIAQGEMTDALNIPRQYLRQTVVGMAHFAGTGPFGAECQHCAFWQILGRQKKPICDKYRRMTGDKNKPVPGNSSACRYYQQK